MRSVRLAAHSLRKHCQLWRSALRTSSEGVGLFMLNAMHFSSGEREARRAEIEVAEADHGEALRTPAVRIECDLCCTKCMPSASH